MGCRPQTGTVPTLNMFALYKYKYVRNRNLRSVTTILHCVSAVMAMVIAILRKYVCNKSNIFKASTVPQVIRLPKSCVAYLRVWCCHSVHAYGSTRSLQAKTGPGLNACGGTTSLQAKTGPGLHACGWLQISASQNRLWAACLWWHHISASQNRPWPECLPSLRQYAQKQNMCVINETWT